MTCIKVTILNSCVSTGSPEARAQELIDATTDAIYQYVATMMHQRHTQLFALLVSLERMRMSQQLTKQELGLFVNGVDTSDIENSIVFDNKPEWVTNKVLNESIRFRKLISHVNKYTCAKRLLNYSHNL